MNPRMEAALGWLLAIAVAAGFCRLGFWQLDRMRQKQALLDAARKVLDERVPRPLSLAADPSRAHGYDWAAGAGEFAPAPALLLDNQERDGRSGVRAYRVFVPAGGAPLLVELGWLPLPGERTLPAVELPAGPRSVRGLLTPPPSRGLLAAVATKQANGDVLATGLDAAGLAAGLGVASLPPRVLRLDPTLKLGYARDLDVLPNTLPPARHLAYAVQWFGLSLAVLATAAVLTLRRRRTGHAKMAA